jgi:hypothetical protein
MDACDARPYRAGYLADLELPSCRARARAGFVCCGEVPVCPGLARGPAARENRSGRSARLSLPMRSTPMSRAVGIPHEVDRTAQNQDLFLQYRGIRYELLHSVTRCSAGSQKARASERNGNARHPPGLVTWPSRLAGITGRQGNLPCSPNQPASLPARLSTLRRRCRGAWSTAAGQPAFGERFAPAAHHIHIQPLRNRRIR